MEQYVIPALIGLLGGVVGSLIAPWVHWRIEKRRLLYQSRLEFVRAARELLSQPPERSELRNAPVYSRLRPYLSDLTREIVESETIHVQIGGRGGGANNYVPSMLDDIRKLEEEWELI